MSPQILQGVNASDQGCPVEAEARLPESLTEASTCPHFSQKGGRWETVHSSGLQRSYESESRGKGKKGPETVPAHEPPPGT